MKLQFKLAQDGHDANITADITTCIVAGWAGRDLEAIEHHIEELAEIGVPRPSAVPLYYRIASNQLTQESEIEVVGDGSSGEAEVFIFSHEGKTIVSLASDHTDRKLEAHSVALSKQLCAKPVARDAWLFDDVAEYWDELVLRSRIEEGGKTVLYQEGELASLRPPHELVQDHFGQATIPQHCGMVCGTVAASGPRTCSRWNYSTRGAIAASRILTASRSCPRSLKLRQVGCGPNNYQEGNHAYYYPGASVGSAERYYDVCRTH